MRYVGKFFGHLRNIFVHKWWVFYYACKFGIPWRGFMHDWSKFHPTEFFESVKYYQGDKSPIPVCKKENGVSLAWQHHKGHNPHHYEYWTDNYDSGSRTCHPMPYEYVMEMLADWFAAGRTYHGKDFTGRDEFKWWRSKSGSIALAPETYMFVAVIMSKTDFWGSIDWMSDKRTRKALRAHYDRLLKN